MAEITCVMPVHNCPHIVELGVRSVLEQDFEDWDFIIVDDSTDETPGIVDALVADDPRVRHIHLDRWMSLMRSRDVGVAAGTGRWIAQFDADDYQPPCRLAVQRAATDDPMAVGHIPFVHFAAPFSDDNRIWQLQPNRSPLGLACGSTFFYSRELWHRIGGHDLDKQRGGDWRFAHKVMHAGASALPAPSAYAEFFLGIEHDANNWQKSRLTPPGFQPTDREWPDELPAWAQDVVATHPQANRRTTG